MRVRSRSILLLAIGASLALTSPARAKEPKCPLELSVCLAQFELMKERPWLGVTLEADSVAGGPVVRSLSPGSPAKKGGLGVGDVIESIDGHDPGDWFAGKAGWKTSGTERIAFLRDGRELVKDVPIEKIPEDLFAQLLGTHILEGHLAYMHVQDGHMEDGADAEPR